MGLSNPIIPNSSIGLGLVRPTQELQLAISIVLLTLSNLVKSFFCLHTKSLHSLPFPSNISSSHLTPVLQHRHTPPPPSKSNTTTQHQHPIPHYPIKYEPNIGCTQHHGPTESCHHLPTIHACNLNLWGSSSATLSPPRPFNSSIPHWQRWSHWLWCRAQSPLCSSLPLFMFFVGFCACLVKGFLGLGWCVLN